MTATWRGHDLGLLLALLLGAALRLLSPGLRAELWYDEAYVVELAGRPPGEMLHLLRLGGDTNPPLYTFLLRAWLALGGSDLHLRSLSLLLGVGAIAAAFRLGGRLGGPWAGRLSALLLAISGWGIHYSLEVRPYALFLLLGLLSTLALLDAQGGPPGEPSRGLRPWTGYVLWTTLAIYSHWFGLLLLPAHAAGLLAQPVGAEAPLARPGRAALRAWGAIALACLPLLPLALNQVGLQAEVGGFAWPARPSGASLMGLATALAGGRGGLAVAALALGLAIVLPGRAAARAAPGGRSLLFLGLCLAVPIAAAFAASAIAERFSFLVDRYFLPFAAHGLVLLGLCLVRVGRPLAPLLFAAVAVLSGLDAAARAARRAPPTWRPLNTLACDALSGPALRLHLTPLTYLPARRYRPADCAVEDALVWDPTAGPGYVLDYARRGELLPAHVLTAYPDGLCPLASFGVVSDPAQAGRGREGHLLERLRSNPWFVRTASGGVGAVAFERFETRCGATATRGGPEGR